jgi:hypothetical protein
VFSPESSHPLRASLLTVPHNNIMQYPTPKQGNPVTKGVCAIAQHSNSIGGMARLDLAR